MKRRLSSVILLAGVLVMTAAVLAAMGLQGKLTKPVRDIARVDAPVSDIVRADEDGVRININTADESALCQLPGIGESLSGMIVACRLENGPFASVEDLKNISGIGDAKLDAIRPYIFCE